MISHLLTIDTRLTKCQREYIDPSETGINIIPSEIILCIISQLEEKNYSLIAQVSHKFNKLTEQCRELLYRNENFDTLMVKLGAGIVDIDSIRWLIRHYPEREYSHNVVFDDLGLIDRFSDGNEIILLEIIRFLLKTNKLYQKDALGYASYNGHTKIVKLLLDTHSPKNFTKWALNWASRNGHIEVVKLFLAAKTPCSYCALDWASKNGHTEIVKLLLAARKDCSVAALN